MPNFFSPHDSLDLLDAIDAIIYVADLETYEVLYLNKKAQQLFGDGVGKSCWKVLQADQDGPCSFCTNDKLFNQDGSPAEPWVWEFQNTLNGEWWECRDRVIQWTDGRYVRLEIAVNITERKQIKEQLIESERKFRLMANVSQDWEYWIDAEGQYKYISPVCERMTGIPPEELFENPDLLFDLIIPEDRERVYSHYNNPDERCETARLIEFSIVDRNGALRHIEHYCAPVYGDDGEFAGRCGNNRDITSRKQAEVNLKLSEERLSFALKGAKCGLWDWNIVDNSVHFDENYYRMAGYLPNEFPQSFASWEERVHPADIAQAKERLNSYLAGEAENFSAEFRFRKKDGGWVWILGQGEFVEWQDDGSPLRITGLHIDIDDSKQQEGKRMELEQQLRQKFKMEAVGTMAGGMAHNFNNSLAIILGSLEMAQRKIDKPERVAGYLDTAKTAALRSRDLVQQILSYSRLEVQKKKPIKIAMVLDETQKMLRPTIPSSIDFLYQPEPDCLDIVVEASSGQIQEVILNLSNNAVQAMDGRGSLKISLDESVLTAADIPAHSQCLPGPFARISVKDSGGGIDPELLGKIFDPFFTTKGVDQGTGIGLSTVQGIMQQHGGLVLVRNSFGAGCCFELYFPLRPPEMIAESSPEILEPPIGSERILFVDDETELAEVNRQLLTELGYRVTVETSSTDALGRLSSEPENYDLLVTDQTMPELTGKDLALAVQQLKPGLPVILCTGYSSMISPEDAEQYGISAFCSKPLQLNELAQTIRRVLDK